MNSNIFNLTATTSCPTKNEGQLGYTVFELNSNALDWDIEVFDNLGELLHIEHPIRLRIILYGNLEAEAFIEICKLAASILEKQYDKNKRIYMHQTKQIEKNNEKGG